MFVDDKYYLCLCTRYQTTVEVSATTQETLVNNGEEKPKQVFKEVTSDSKHLQCGKNN